MDVKKIAKSLNPFQKKHDTNPKAKVSLRQNLLRIKIEYSL